MYTCRSWALHNLFLHSFTITIPSQTSSNLTLSLWLSNTAFCIPQTFNPYCLLVKSAEVTSRDTSTSLLLPAPTPRLSLNTAHLTLAGFLCSWPCSSVHLKWPHSSDHQQDFSSHSLTLSYWGSPRYRALPSQKKKKIMETAWYILQPLTLEEAEASWDFVPCPRLCGFLVGSPGLKTEVL